MMTRLSTSIAVTTFMTFFLVTTSLGQTIKVGILPYADATAAGQAGIGDSLSRLTQAEIVHSTQMEGRALQITSGLTPQQLDSEKIVALGKEQNVDMVVMGTVLDAHADESAQNTSPRSIFGQSINANLHSYKATVTLQADLYDVATGKKLDSFRVTQTQSDKKIGAGAATSLGTLNTASSALQNSTLGKALQKTIAQLVKRIDQEKTKTTPAARAGS
jgi:hypothetical protein